jgi:hypothetical protein
MASTLKLKQLQALFVQGRSELRGGGAAWSAACVGDFVRRVDARAERLCIRMTYADKRERAKLFDPVLRRSGQPVTAQDAEAWLDSLIVVYQAKYKALKAAMKISLQPTADELDVAGEGGLSDAVTRLWSLDENRLIAGVDYALDLQTCKSSRDERDMASRPLFRFVKGEAIAKPTFRTFLALLSHYSIVTGQSEDVTDKERREQRDFVDACMNTKCLRYCYQFLRALTKERKDGKFTDEGSFKRAVHEMWFHLYSRQAHNDSSGFEHVFVGEIAGERHREKAGEVLGMHNWLAIMREEQKGNLNYKGWVRPRRRSRIKTAESELEQVLQLQFEWHGSLKPVGTSLVGTSPEFEISLYMLLLFGAGEGEHTLDVGPYRLTLKLYVQSYYDKTRHKRVPTTWVSTAYPDLPPLSEEEAAVQLQAIARGRQRRLDRRAGRLPETSSGASLLGGSSSSLLLPGPVIGGSSSIAAPKTSHGTGAWGQKRDWGGGGVGGVGGAAVGATVLGEVGPDGVEQRIDPSDNQLYTKAEFEQCYGLECSQWQLAGELMQPPPPPQQQREDGRHTATVSVKEVEVLLPEEKSNESEQAARVEEPLCCCVIC